MYAAQQSVTCSYIKLTFPTFRYSTRAHKCVTRSMVWWTTGGPGTSLSDPSPGLFIPLKTCTHGEPAALHPWRALRHSQHTAAQPPPKLQPTQKIWPTLYEDNSVGHPKRWNHTFLSSTKCMEKIKSNECQETIRHKRALLFEEVWIIHISDPLLSNT